MVAFINLRTPKQYNKRVKTHESAYHSLFSFNDETVAWLAEYFLGNVNTTRGGTLTSKQRMEIF